MLRTFKIAVYNGGGYEIDSAEIKALDGTRAILKYIEQVAPIIEDGDTIRIEEE